MLQWTSFWGHFNDCMKEIVPNFWRGGPSYLLAQTSSFGHGNKIFNFCLRSATSPYVCISNDVSLYIKWLSMLLWRTSWGTLLSNRVVLYCTILDGLCISFMISRAFFCSFSSYVLELWLNCYFVSVLASLLFYLFVSDRTEYYIHWS